MYSPPAGGAARRLSATIDKQHTSKRRFIVSGENDYLCGPRNSASARVGSPGAPSHRKRRANCPAADRLQVVLTILQSLLRPRGLPMFAASESGRTYPHESALLQEADANCSWTPL